MSNVPSELKYTSSHEWIRDEGDGTVTVGITEHAQELLGDLVFVELPEVGAELIQMEPFGAIEAVKAASDLYSPVSGEVVAVNEAINDDPAVVNRSPYEEGWMVRAKLSDPAQFEALLTAADYAKVVAELAEGGESS